MKNADRDDAARRTYPLGHAKHEFARLADQARIDDPITRRFLIDAGIAPGMRVLDIGSAAGHMAFLLADLVGTTGEVVGSDKSSDAIAAAREGAAARSLANVGFREGDPSEMSFDQPFDAVAGRWVVMFNPDPAGFIRRLSRHLRPGGVMFFQEVDRAGARSFPPAPLYDRCTRWITEALAANGDETRQGLKLYGAFVAAGLPPPQMRLEALIGGGANIAPNLRQMAELVRTSIPTLERYGVAAAAEIGIDDLAERLVAEAAAGHAVLVDRSEIGVWSRKQ